MSDKLDFSLPKKKTAINTVSLVILIISAAVFLLSAATLVFVLGRPAGAGGDLASSGLGPAALKELALRFQKNGLGEQAARAWKGYLAAGNVGADEKANVLYTIGTLYQDAGLYEEALSGFYQSEAVKKDGRLGQEISRRVEECLESLGKFAALRRELAERVSIDKDAKADEVVAQIGPEKITRSDLDARIEQFISFALAQNASYYPPEQQNALKEQLFKNYSGDDGRMKMLNQFVVEEVLYRTAREEKIAENPETRAFLKEVERQLLGQKLLSNKVGSTITLTESDLSNHYEANRAKYIKDGVQQQFADVRQDVYADLRKQKEEELSARFLEELKKKYNVVIFPSKLKQGGQPGK